MSILVTEREAGAAWLWTTRDGRRQALQTGALAPGMPAQAANAVLLACARTEQVYCAPLDTLACARTFPAPPGLCALCASPCGRYAYLLGGDADCVQTRCLRTGELLFVQRAGVFPRDMRLHPSGRWLAVAGGASGEALLLSAPELRLRRRIRVRGAVCAVDFVPDGLLLLCAVGERELRTALVHAAGECPRELWRAEGPPGALRAAGNGCALVGAWGGLALLSWREGRLLWQRPELPLAGGIDLRGDQALVSDTLSGPTTLLPLRQPWLSRALCPGVDVRAIFVSRV